jgi:aminobenzoyl-glutamate utilization protein B
MEREGLSGTLVLWPGVAEELLGSKAWFVRDGRFRDLDAVLFTHVGSNFSVSWGQGNGTGLVSAEFTFTGEAAHAAGAPWRGRSALDAVELMNVAWNFRREHLRPQQRSHHVIVDGGDQPNVVPSSATVWYFVREMDQAQIKENFDALVRVAQGAALMTDTEMSYRIIGTAYPRHFNRPIAQAMYAHMRTVGLPAWTEADRALARAVQGAVGGRLLGLADTIAPMGPPPEQPESGGSDDIGDVSWAVPTVTLYFPANIPDLPGHHWANAVSMATPIAHKGALAGAQVIARTAMELVGRPELVREAWAYYLDEQTRDHQYVPFIDGDDAPAIDKNRSVMDEFRPRIESFYFDENTYDTYLEQLGVTYPTLEPLAAEDGSRDLGP